jgi:hypothetical protein
MHYKTIVLELLRERPDLRSEATQFQDMNRLAMVLKTNHETWMSELRQRTPGRAEEQITAEALELALDELLRSSASGSSAAGGTGQPLSLDAAMAFLKKPSPTG